ncbi:nitronate monooxygenase [Mycolicibacterium goodii]|uniref:nitronate monooxygenase n=1 Tax=Mycolicibacterium goodii TaxID=134601 RepID=UPI000C26108C|nr:nitronate monooxygenase [Mycolicibacterium goodii]PJK18382.1 hypothetical protein CSX11_32025 [Mycolicibacterium goodii]
MTTALTDLNLTIPVIAAPMSGGPTTVAMVIAAHRAERAGVSGTGYKTPESVQAELDAIREVSIPFGVNVFVPAPCPSNRNPTAGIIWKLQASGSMAAKTVTSRGEAMIAAAAGADASPWGLVGSACWISPPNLTRQPIRHNDPSHG